MNIIDSIKNKRNGLLSGVIYMMLIVFGASCSDDDDQFGADLWDNGDNVMVSTQPERTRMIRNPMMGWVLYTGIGDGLSETFWQDYDNINTQKGGKVRVSDYAGTLYIRGAWSDFNPEEGKYIWKEGTVNTKPAQRFKMLVDGAKERGLKLAFTFVVDSRDKHYDFTPKYVKESPGIEGYTTTTGSVQVWSPYPDNVVFQQHYANFVKEFAKTFNDPDLVQFISGQGLGKWGEYHTVWYYQVQKENKPELSVRESVFDFVTDLYATAFDKVPVIINYHRWIGTAKEWDGSNYDPDTERLLQKAINKGFSLRHDAFGMKTYYTTWERAFVANYRYKRPIIMEGGWVQGSHGGSIKGDGYETYADVRKGEYNEGKGAFVNMMDFRYNSSMQSSETYCWFNEAFSLVNEFIAEGGYRFYPDKISVPADVSNGATIRITHRWSNLGWGYCPTNIPQWQGKYKVAFALLDKSTLQPKYTFINDEPELCEWIKGTPKTYGFTLKVSDVAVGDYMWAVGLVDTTKDNAIGIQISVKEDRLTPDGWLKLHDVTIH